MAASPIAWPLVLLYAMGVRLKNAAYDLHAAKPRRLTWPVIGVGNLSVGGTGKTPLVLLLAGLLEKRGWHVDVLSRGYGRAGTQNARVAPERDWMAFGDEPFLMAQRGAAVYVGADRYKAGLLAETDGSRDETARQKNTRHLHLLDDGFQHRKLGRTLDIVLLRRRDLEDEMLPLGRLREPLAALERADVCVLRAEDADLRSRVLHLMRQTDRARVWIVKRRTILPTSGKLPGPDSPALAFCAIGDAEGFFQSLRDAGVDVRAGIAFRDHHVYTAADIARLKAAARESGAQCFIATEKDKVRIDSTLWDKLEETLPLGIARLELSLEDELNCVLLLESLIAQRLQRLPQAVR